MSGFFLSEKQRCFCMRMRVKGHSFHIVTAVNLLYFSDFEDELDDDYVHHGDGCACSQRWSMWSAGETSRRSKTTSTSFTSFQGA